jgi:rRNA maturation protein Nop10
MRRQTNTINWSAQLPLAQGIRYVHAVEPGTHPVRFIPHDEFERFMKEMGKTSWTMQPVELSRPQAAVTFIQQCLLVGYTWLPHHNCVTLCKEICTHGGGNVVPSSAFPTTSTKDRGNIPKPAFSHPYDSITNDML